MLVGVMLLQKKGQDVKEMRQMELDIAGNINNFLHLEYEKANTCFTICSA